jgi:hypothetical protein
VQLAILAEIPGYLMRGQNPVDIGAVLDARRRRNLGPKAANQIIDALPKRPGSRRCS